MKRTFLSILCMLCCSIIMFAGTSTRVALSAGNGSVLPSYVSFSTVESPVWYGVFFYYGKSYLSDEGVETDMVTVEDMKLDNSKFQLVGTEQSFKMRSKAGHWVSYDSSKDRFVTVSDSSNASELAVVPSVSTEGLFEIKRTASGMVMSQNGGRGIGNKLREWYLDYSENRVLFIGDSPVELPSSLIKTSSANVKTSLVNDSKIPWLVNENGDLEVQTSLGDSWTELCIDVETPERAVMSMDCELMRDYYDQFQIIVNGRSAFNSENGYNPYLGQNEIFLDKGKSKLVLRYYKRYSGNNDQYLRLRNLQLMEADSLISTVHVVAPGTLGNEVLAQFQTLPDVKYLRVKGTLNLKDFDILKQMSNLKILDMKETSVIEIPDNAFENHEIQWVDFPVGLKRIGSYAFKSYNGQQLTGTLNLPASLEEIGERAFTATGFHRCALPAKAQRLGNYVFYDCNKVEEFSFTLQHQYIPENFLDNCDSLKIVEGTDSVTVVGGYAFSNCNYLTSVGKIAPFMVMDAAFSGCNRLKAIDLSRAVSIGNSAFYNCDSLKTLNLSAAQVIGNSAFSSCSFLQSVKLERLQSLKNYAFQDCDSLQEVVLPDLTTEVLDYAFSGCQSLKKVTLGASLRLLPNDLFRYCENIKKVICRAPTPPHWYNNDVFHSKIPTSSTLVVPEYAMVSYKLDEHWSKFNKVETHSENVGHLTLSGTLDLSTNARIPGVPTLVQNLDSHFSVNGNNPQMFNGYLLQLADPNYNSSDVPATFISRCDNMTSKMSAVQTYMREGSWYYVCYPFDVKLSNVWVQDNVQLAIRYYDGESRAVNGAGLSWTDVPYDGMLKAHQGYIVQVSNRSWVRMIATDETHNDIFKNQSIEIPLVEHASESSADRNWNMVGNPYPSYFDIYYLDYTAPITVWDSYNRTYQAYSVADDDYVLMPMQAFFVQRPEGLASIKFNKDGRQDSPEIDHSFLPGHQTYHAENPRYIVDLDLSNGRMSDRTRIVCNAASNDGYDSNTDAAKMMSSVTDVPQLYSWTAEADFSINEGPQADGMINLGVYIPKDGTYTFALHRADVEVELIDMLENESTVLSEPYVFTAKAGSYDNRFCLKLKTKEVTGLNQAEVDAKVVPATGGIRVSAAQGSKVQVYTTDGRSVVAQTMTGDNQFIVLPAGLYVIDIDGEVVKALVH